VLADACVFTTRRQDPESGIGVAADLPDSLRLITELENGARGLYHVSGVTHFQPRSCIAFYGADGTIVYDLTAGKIFGGRAGEDDRLEEIPIPAQRRREWAVEADFIAAIRGERPVELTTFEIGVQYMEFTEAAYRSALNSAPVDLPLES
jgi:predicted dehydrogenase